MPGLDKLLRGILQYRTKVKPDMLEHFKRVKDNPQVDGLIYRVRR